VQEAHDDLDARAARSFEQHVGLLRGMFCRFPGRVRARHDDAELPTQAILAGGCRVREEQISLVEHRVRDGTSGREHG
jgi:hypothetical protein